MICSICTETKFGNTRQVVLANQESSAAAKENWFERILHENNVLFSVFNTTLMAHGHGVLIR